MEAYLGKCLDSLLLRKDDGTVDDGLMQALEVLVINDGSKDRTSEIGHGYEAKYPGTFRVIDKANGHYGSCVNRGLAEAKGTFIRVLDADDYVDNAKFKGFMELLLSFEPDKLPDAVMTDYDCVDEMGILKARMQFTNLPQKSFFTFEKLNNIGKYFYQNHNLTYRTGIFNLFAYNQTEGCLYSDSEWYILPMTKVNEVYYYPESVVQYLVGREGQSISLQVALKNFDKRLQLDLGIVGKLEKLAVTATVGGKKFTKERMLQLLRNHYLRVFDGNHNDEQSLELLKRFDEALKTLSPFYYKQVGETVRLRWHFVSLAYINEWRRHYSMLTWRFLLYRLLVNLGNIGHRIKKLFWKKGVSQGN